MRQTNRRNFFFITLFILILLDCITQSLKKNKIKFLLEHSAIYFFELIFMNINIISNQIKLI